MALPLMRPMPVMTPSAGSRAAAPRSRGDALRRYGQRAVLDETPVVDEVGEVFPRAAAPRGDAAARASGRSRITAAREALDAAPQLRPLAVALPSLVAAHSAACAHRGHGQRLASAPGTAARASRRRRSRPRGSRRTGDAQDCCIAASALIISPKFTPSAMASACLLYCTARGALFASCPCPGFLRCQFPRLPQPRGCTARARGSAARRPARRR
jgi:hypothetical protein